VAPVSRRLDGLQSATELGGVSSGLTEDASDIRVAWTEILPFGTKHLVDIDDETLDHARAELGTSTIKDTVNEALRRTVENRPSRLTAALDTLAAADLEDRTAAWR
jgi:Arc/MetJ family transcription regulator